MRFTDKKKKKKENKRKRKKERKKAKRNEERRIESTEVISWAYNCLRKRERKGKGQRNRKKENLVLTRGWQENKIKKLTGEMEVSCNDRKLFVVWK